MADFADLEKTLRALSSNVAPSNIAKINKKASLELRKANADRIRANITPDNSPMAARAKSNPFRPASKARFLYPSGGNGKPRIVILNAWTIEGQVIKGFDEKRGGLRIFIRSKIIRWLPNLRPEFANNSAGEFKGLKDKKRSGKMFKKLPKPSFLKVKSTADFFKISFPSGNAAIIAPAHHYGTSFGKSVLPERPLLGFNKKDEDAILEAYANGLKF